MIENLLKLFQTHFNTSPEVQWIGNLYFDNRSCEELLQVCKNNNEDLLFQSNFDMSSYSLIFWAQPPTLE